MVIILEDLCGKLVPKQFHTAHKKASGLKNFYVVDPGFNPRLSQ